MQKTNKIHLMYAGGINREMNQLLRNLGKAKIKIEAMFVTNSIFFFFFNLVKFIFPLLVTIFPSEIRAFHGVYMQL